MTDIVYFSNSLWVEKADAPTSQAPDHTGSDDLHQRKPTPSKPAMIVAQNMAQKNAIAHTLKPRLFPWLVI